MSEVLILSQGDDVLLPTSETALDQFVSDVCAKFNLPTHDDTYDAIATMIMHMPHTKAYAPLAYFGNGVLKSMANRAAYNRLRTLAEKRKAAEEAKEKEKAALTLVPQEPNAANEQPVQNS